MIIKMRSEGKTTIDMAKAMPLRTSQAINQQAFKLKQDGIIPEGRIQTAGKTSWTAEDDEIITKVLRDWNLPKGKAFGRDGVPTIDDITRQYNGTRTREAIIVRIGILRKKMEKELGTVKDLE